MWPCSLIVIHPKGTRPPLSHFKIALAPPNNALPSFCEKHNIKKHR